MRAKRKQSKTATPAGQQKPSSPVIRSTSLSRTKAANFNQNAAEISEALLIAGLRQHELTEVAENLNTQLQAEIVERTKAEKALRESEERFRLMADNISPMAWMANADGYIFFYNKRWYEYTGTNLEEMQGWGWAKVHHPDHLSRVTGLWTAHLRNGEPWEDTFPIRGKNGKYRWFLSRAFPIRDSAGNILRWFGTNADITASREAQEALQNAQEELQRYAVKLENTVAERTAALRETVGDLESFSYSVAHDMRAPLRSMRSFSQILLKDYAGALDAIAVDYLERIARSSGRLDRLILDVLNYTKILRGELVREPVDLDRLLRDILDTYPGWQPPKAEIQIQGPLPRVLGNEAFLTQCISNLLSNAVIFVSPGTVPCVQIWAEPKGSHVRLCIQDNGIGIACDERARIFRMFERLHPAADFEGTGIGLSIARKAVERMGGAIDFDSEPGKGSTFWIDLENG